MFVEFHTLDGKDLFVNFALVYYVADAEVGSVLHFRDVQIPIKETIIDIKRQFQLMAMQGQLAGRA